MANIAAQVAHRAGAQVEGPTAPPKRLRDGITGGAHLSVFNSLKNRLRKCIHNVPLLLSCDIGDALIDPYIKVALMPWRVSGQTSTKLDQEDDISIKWDETINLLLPDEEGAGLVIQAWDEDVGEDDLLGQAEIGWEKIHAAINAPNQPQDVIVVLKDAEEEECGGARMSITFEPLQPDQNVKNQQTGKWKGASLGNLAVHVNTVTGLHNPFTEVVTTADDQRLIMKCTLLAVFYFVLGALVFGQCTKDIEDANGDTQTVNWTVVDSMYFAVVTITTTGYGDLLPNTDAAKLFACFFAYFGVGVIAAVMGFLLAIIVEKHSGQNLLDQVKHAASAAVHRAEGALSNTMHINKQHLFKIPFIGHFDKRKIPWKYLRAGGALLVFKFAGALYFTQYDGTLAHCNTFLRNGKTILETVKPKDTMKNITAATWANATVGDLPPSAERWSWSTDEIERTPVLAGGACDCNHMWGPPENLQGDYAARLAHFEKLGYCTIPDRSGVDGARHHMKSFLDAIYMACITMTSVGYGEMSPQNQNARGFAIVWILGGTLFVGNFFGMLVDDYMAAQQRKLAKRLLKREFGADDMRKLDKDGDGEVTETEFFMYMIVKLGKTDKREVEGLRQQFRDVDKTGDGFITKEDLEIAQEQRSESFKA